MAYNPSNMSYDPLISTAYDPHNMEYSPLNSRTHDRDRDYVPSPSNHPTDHPTSTPLPSSPSSPHPPSDSESLSPQSPPREGLGYYSDYSSDSDPSDTSYSPPPQPPTEPCLEYKAYADDYPSEYSEDTDPEDVEYAPPREEPLEPGLEYATSCATESESDEEDEMASRGRARRRAEIRKKHIQEVKEIMENYDADGDGIRRSAIENSTAKLLDNSLKVSLVALRAQELKKIREDNENRKKTPRWKSMVHKFLVLVVVFVAAFAAVWVVNEVNYRGGLPYVKMFRGYVCSDDV